MSDQPDAATLVELATDIVSAYVSHNTVPVGDLPALIGRVHSALQTAEGGSEPVEEAPAAPAVPVRKSVTPDYIICLEDGKKFKSLKRHLSTKFGMSPDEYRAKWNLPHDYPMVAPNYAAARAEMARNIGLGQKRRVVVVPQVMVAVEKPRATRGRKKAA